MIVRAVKRTGNKALFAAPDIQGVSGLTTIFFPRLIRRLGRTFPSTLEVIPYPPPQLQERLWTLEFETRMSRAGGFEITLDPDRDVDLLS